MNSRLDLHSNRRETFEVLLAQREAIRDLFALPTFQKEKNKRA
jgi:hypothetical protein